ncbi:hypothetical protein DY000_02061535 [Brassica cretica]|uniref:Uncharacterized protein n=1 Tax=Brassica cretica TaxID=69181 RepID=A0ABQ7AU10_BRACR|nr:hypothetical protein DY000_02061535 [Brassica cretica]
MEEEHQPQSDHEVSKELEEEVSKETVEEEVVDIGQLETEEPIKKVDGETEVVDTPVPDLGRGLHEKKHPTRLQDYILSTVQNHFHRGFLVSPVSHLDPFWTRVSPHSAREYPHASPNDVEPKVIAEKGFYVLLSPRSGAEQAPKLLTLFPLPLRSPNATNQWTEEDYRKS